MNIPDPARPLSIYKSIQRMTCAALTCNTIKTNEKNAIHEKGSKCRADLHCTENSGSSSG